MVGRGWAMLLVDWVLGLRLIGVCLDAVCGTLRLLDAVLVLVRFRRLHRPRHPSRPRQPCTFESSMLQACSNSLTPGGARRCRNLRK